MTQDVLLPDTSDIQVHSVLESKNGFMVVGDLKDEGVEVTRTESGFECNCFFSKVSPENDCEHVLAVKQHQRNILSGEEFPVMSQADADHYLSKVAKLDARLEESQLSAENQIARIQLWLEAETEKVNRQKEYYLFVLETYMHYQDLSTQKLVNGVLKLRAQQPEILIHDEEVVMSDSRFTRIVPEKRTVDKRVLRKHLVTTGEEVEGTEVVMKPAKFSYSIHSGAI